MAKHCPVSAGKFNEQATDMVVSLGGQPAVAKKYRFKSGSVGWRINDKIKVKVVIDGKEVIVDVQVGANLTLIGSRPEGV